jgi:Metallo-beta-lactamase superfamily
MKTISRILLGALSFGAVDSLAAADASSSPPRAPRPELAYLKAVNLQGPTRDPQMLFLLMADYANANRHREGAEFLEERRKAFDSKLTDPQRSLYLTAIAALRAGAAGEIPLLQRIRWVRETISMLDQAEKLSGGDIFVVRWISGVVRSQLPARFHQKQKAYQDLEWCLANAAKAPDDGWIRPAELRLAVLYREDGDSAKAQKFLRLSGASSFESPVTLSPYSEDAVTGHTFSAKRVREIVPGRVYQTSGYDFAELYFVVSQDGRELVAIDAGTRPDSTQAAYEALRGFAPKLPELTTVLVTHSHWDHIGGHRFFRSLKPIPRFYARENFAQTLALGADAPPLIHRFFGSRFRMEDAVSFRPDVTSSSCTRGGCPRRPRPQPRNVPERDFPPLRFRRESRGEGLRRGEGSGWSAGPSESAASGLTLDPSPGLLSGPIRLPAALSAMSSESRRSRVSGRFALMTQWIANRR